MTDDLLRLEYVPLSQVVLWDENPKLHDKDGIEASIRKHGFKDPPKYEPALNGGSGGLAEGNGRLICLQAMRDTGEPPPRGIALAEGGQWAIPILFGVDAASEAAAEAYALDHNNLTILGGAGFGITDTAYLYDVEGYLDILSHLGEQHSLPSSITSDDLDALRLSTGLLDDLDKLLALKDDDKETGGETLYALRLRTGDRALFEEVVEDVGAYVRRKGWKVEIEVTS